MCACGNYLDNLALADQSLGELRQAIAQSPLAAHTILVVSSDHSWRVPIWSSSPGWTKEEDRISHEKFDTRPVFMVHFPGEIQGARVGAPVPELAEHQVLSSMLKGSVSDPESLLRAIQPPPATPK
ncbi:MAG: hypothetical protein P4K83_01410 [Terracidiphilus sp.]|nr:hypothetical protein [Terracidiphilus sp.]